MNENKNLESILKYFYSGGFDNIDPILSLGGEISNNIVKINKENVFSNLDQNSYNQGLTDYRCLYLKNIANKRVHKLSIFLNDVFKGAIFNLGFNLKNEIQNITLSGGDFINNQYIIFSYKERKFKVKYNTNPNIFSLNFQTSIRKIFTLQDVIVEGLHANGTSVLNVFFNGYAGNKQHPLIKVESYSLTPNPIFYISRKQTGSPINCIQNKINNFLQEPADVKFFDLTDQIEFGFLEVGDFLPIWLRRNVFSGSIPIEDDGCNIFTKALIEFNRS